MRQSNFSQPRLILLLCYQLCLFTEEILMDQPLSFEVDLPKIFKLYFSFFWVHICNVGSVLVMNMQH